MKKLRRFTSEQMKSLAANPYTSRVTFRRIWHTDEFVKLFLERYENGDSSLEIFASCGYDTTVLGVNRVCGFPHRAMKLLEISQPTGSAEKTRAGGLQDMNYDAVPAKRFASCRYWKL